MNEPKICPGCGKTPPEYMNYCNWECHTMAALKEGGKAHCPNGLPVRCIDRDGNMWEHEHGNHPDYKFPVTVVFTAPRPPLPDWDDSYTKEWHALIYTDGIIAVTMYECNYSIWLLHNGEYLGGRYNTKEWKLDEESVKAVVDYYEKTKAQTLANQVS